MKRSLLLLTAALVSLAGCEKPIEPVIQALPGPSAGEATRLGGEVGAADVRVSGPVGKPPSAPPVGVSFSAAPSLTAPSAPHESPSGDIMLDFADTDIREVAAQILGTLLKVNYAIDPAVHGTATLHTTRPVSRAALLPTLEALLAQNGAGLVQSDSLYRVVPANAAGGVATGGPGTSGIVAVPLRYAAAEELTKVLQQFVGTGAKIAADQTRNAVLISGEPGPRQTLIDLVHAFDIDVLANQSYAILPVNSGDTKDFATAMEAALRGGNNGGLSGYVKVIPMARADAVLVVSPQARYIESARRVFALVEQARRRTVRSWHIHYLQNGRANDIAYVLQQAFTPNNVTAQPDQKQSPTGPAGLTTQAGGGGNSGFGSSGSSGFGGGSSGFGGSSSGFGGGLSGGSAFGGGSGGYGGGGSLASNGGLPTAGGGAQAGAAPTPSANPLLGGLGGGGGGGGSGEDTTEMLRIIPNPQNNAVLIYATEEEEERIRAMLRKIDILPLEVRIDATIAEVTLNDNLKYGTQFFFKSGGINGILSNSVQTVTNLNNATLNATFPGFVLAGGTGQGGAPIAISALQEVTDVHVLSSPEILVLDNQAARLQVGAVVPYLSQSSQSTLSSNAPIVNSVNYQQTGVILQVTPRVNSGGLVTLDIDQEVSDVAAGVTTAGINSPTFNERSITSRVVVQDGQTVGLAGLIRDNVTRDNAGIPWLKDIPILGALAGTQTNTRSRNELLVLITPHVVHDQRDARALTEDLRDQLVHAAAVPDELNSLPPSGSPDPNRRLRQKVQQKLAPQ